MNVVIEGKKVSKIFGNNKEKVIGLNKVDFKMYEGEFVSIMGSSGSGKSTLLYTFSAIEKPDEGEIIIEGRDIKNFNEDELSDLRRTKFGFVFQNPTMLKNLNILENIILTSFYEKNSNKTSIINKAKELMKKTNIETLEERGITQVSGGQLQRANICRALLNNPSIIFADEPTGALDSKSGEDVMKIFKDIHNGGMTILLVTHDSKVASYGDRVVFMKDGEIKEERVIKNLSKEKKIIEIEDAIKKL